MAECLVCGKDVAHTGFVNLGSGPMCPQCLADAPRLLCQARAAQRLELELSTTEELVDEIVRRETFRGVILWQKESFKGDCRTEWAWRTNNCEIKEILASIMQNLGEKS